MSLSWIHEKNLSEKHRWWTLQPAEVLANPLYGIGGDTFKMQGAHIDGRLYHESYKRKALEKHINEDTYQQKGFFVILSDGSGCIPIINGLGRNILILAEGLPSTKSSKKSPDQPSSQTVAEINEGNSYAN